jgi:antitoxin component YwqK of YwqJK toxin-antitoxin module
MYDFGIKVDPAAMKNFLYAQLNPLGILLNKQKLIADFLNQRHMATKCILILYSLMITNSLLSQSSKYKTKQFVSQKAEIEFVNELNDSTGFFKTYILAQPEIWDIDNDSSTYIKWGQKALLCFEGQYRKSKREGEVKVYLIDSSNHNLRFKIWEQSYANDRLNGEWKTFTLKGNLVNSQMYRNDTLNGISKYFWIDGKTTIEERRYFESGRI